MAVTFLTTEDGQAINTQLSNLVTEIAELNRQLRMSDVYENKLQVLEMRERDLEKRIKRHNKSKSMKSK